MRTPLRWSLFAALLLTLLFSVACMLSATCPCGEDFERDPFDPTAEFYVGAEHSVSAHCLCQCGGVGDEERMPPSNSCESYETECLLPDGGKSVYQCE